MLEEEVHLE